MRFLAGAVMLMAVLLSTGLAEACERRWFGRAPFCNGSCPSGWTQIRTDRSGDGATCWTGEKVLCEDCSQQQETPECGPSAFVQRTCVGFLLICQNVNPLNGLMCPCEACGPAHLCGLCFFARFGPASSSSGPSLGQEMLDVSLFAGQPQMDPAELDSRVPPFIGSFVNAEVGPIEIRYGPQNEVLIDFGGETSELSGVTLAGNGLGLAAVDSALAGLGLEAVVGANGPQLIIHGTTRLFVFNKTP